MHGDPELRGYLRDDGRKGIRNYVAVCYLVECAHHVSRAIVNSFPERGVHLIGFWWMLSQRLCLTHAEKPLHSS